jgi:hypothetical protein
LSHELGRPGAVIVSVEFGAKIGDLLCRVGAPADPAIDRAKELLGDFSTFWELETEPAERRRLLVSLFEQVWAQGGRIVAVQPPRGLPPLLPGGEPLPEARDEAGCQKRERRDSNPRPLP